AHVPRAVQRDTLGEAEPPRLERDQRARQIVAAGLREGRHGVRGDPLPRRHANVDAALEPALTEIGAPLPRGNRYARRILDVAGDAHLAVAAIGDRPDVGALEAVLPNDLLAGLDEHAPLVRDLHP